ncbi:hypothetical protein [Phyllobacterium endophyticum]|uniref:hypothetical protein n=1 Tax=Phyllobacterium endophyticum TaxID=1149773 RepID=UPI0011CC05C6|nr:hypothetical protein [Phyllobacterium endophyticum]TXR48536.1 hypothetical protein FVA77_14435 [Phyllobacterium endophyticum]
MGLLSGLPDFVIYAIFGAIAGGIGAAVGGLIKGRAKWVRILPVIFVVLSIQATKFSVMPDVRMARTVETLNKDLPKAIDEVTTLNRVSFANGEFVYHYQLADSVPVGTDISPVKTQGLAGMCNSWRGPFISKEVSSVKYQYQLHGTETSFSLLPQECTQ